MSLIGVWTLSVLVIMASANVPDPKPLYDLAEAPALFTQFKKDYNRTYKDEADHKLHFDAFVSSLEQINKQNKESTSATFGINKFADYTAEERKTMFGFNPNLRKKD